MTAAATTSAGSGRASGSGTRRLRSSLHEQTDDGDEGVTDQDRSGRDAQDPDEHFRAHPRVEIEQEDGKRPDLPACRTKGDE